MKLSLQVFSYYEDKQMVSEFKSIYSTGQSGSAMPHLICMAGKVLNCAADDFSVLSGEHVITCGYIDAPPTDLVEVDENCLVKLPVQLSMLEAAKAGAILRLIAAYQYGGFSVGDRIILQCTETERSIAVAILNRFGCYPCGNIEEADGILYDVGGTEHLEQYNEMKGLKHAVVCDPGIGFSDEKYMCGTNTYPDGYIRHAVFNNLGIAVDLIQCDDVSQAVDTKDIVVLRDDTRLRKELPTDDQNDASFPVDFTWVETLCDTCRDRRNAGLLRITMKCCHKDSTYPAVLYGVAKRIVGCTPKEPVDKTVGSGSISTLRFPDGSLCSISVIEGFTTESLRVEWHYDGKTSVIDNGEITMYT